MTRASVTLTQLTSTLGLFFISGSTFDPMFDTGLQTLGFCLIFILTLTSLFLKREASLFGRQVLKWKITQFGNLYICSEWLAVLSNRLCEVAWRRFIAPFGHFFGGSPRTCS